jgi:uncharacterized membrane protein YoaK (UPF0700 family)
MQCLRSELGLRSVYRMISRLPRWVWFGASVLAFIAGIINIVGLLSFAHSAVSHVTGSTSLLGAAVADADWRAAGGLLALIGAFLFGAAVSGALIQDSTLRLGRSYGLVLSIEAIVLALTVPLLNRGGDAGIYALAGACGLQNAMASAYSGAVVRTSHVTGMITDLGIYLGHLVRGTRIEHRRLQLCLIVIVAFFCGGALGAWGFRNVGYSTLYVPAALTGGIAIAYVGYYGTRRRAAVRSE